jgi:hypothetical protein
MLRTTPLERRNLRREERIQAQVPVLLVRGKDEVPVLATDVSYKGLFLRMPTPPPLHALVRLRLGVRSSVWVEAHAMAVHHASGNSRPGGPGGAGVGLQLFGLAGKERSAWDSFVRELIQTKKRSTAQ